MYKALHWSRTTQSALQPSEQCVCILKQSSKQQYIIIVKHRAPLVQSWISDRIARCFEQQKQKQNQTRFCLSCE